MLDLFRVFVGGGWVCFVLRWLWWGSVAVWRVWVRALHPGERIYTFWDYFRNAWARNAGLRIDHLLLSPSIVDRLTAAKVDREVRGWEKASDHAPTWIELADAGASRVLRRRRPLTAGSGRDDG